MGFASAEMLFRSYVLFLAFALAAATVAAGCGAVKPTATVSSTSKDRTQPPSTPANAVTTPPGGEGTTQADGGRGGSHGLPQVAAGSNSVTLGFEHALAIPALCDALSSANALNGYAPASGASPTATQLDRVAASKRALAAELSAITPPPAAAKALSDMIETVRSFDAQEETTAQLERSGQHAAAIQAWRQVGPSTAFYGEFASVGVHYSTKAVYRTIHIAEFPVRCRSFAITLKAVLAR